MTLAIYSAALVIAALADSRATPVADKLMDISGTYSDSGMTIRADPGALSIYVSMCGLLSLDLDPANHKKGALRGAFATVKQQGDLAVDIAVHSGRLVDGSRAGICHGTWTKADGLNVDDRAVTLPRGPSVSSKKLWRAVYTFSIDDEGRLTVSAEFISTKAPYRRLTALYAFSRKSLSDEDTNNE